MPHSFIFPHTHKRPDLCNPRSNIALMHLLVQQFVRLLRPRLVRDDLTHSFIDVHGPGHLWSHLCLSSTLQSRLLHAISPTISCHCFQSHIFSMVLVLCYHHWQTVYIQSVPLTPARHSPSPHFCIHPPLLSLAQRAFLQLYRSSSTTPIKDLRAPLSTNQVVIHAAKIRGLINKGLSLLASGSLCLNRWHQSAFWEHQVDARTPGVQWNGKQRQGLALANNAQIESLLSIFAGTFPGVVQHTFSIFASS